MYHETYLATTVQILKELRKDTDFAIDLSRRSRELIGGAVNWADLGCRRACKGLSDDGNQYMFVEIEEASPDSSEFQKAIAAELEKMGWPDVEIRTEW